MKRLTDEAKAISLPFARKNGQPVRQQKLTKTNKLLRKLTNRRMLLTAKEKDRFAHEKKVAKNLHIIEVQPMMQTKPPT